MTRPSTRCERPAARPGMALVAAALSALCTLLFPTASARADTPLDLDSGGRITDTVGALGHRRGQVEAALDRLHATQHVQLYVTYVHDFSGRNGHDWADATADRNGLGPHDVLLAISTSGRQYAVSAAEDSGFRQDQLSTVAALAISPALKEHDWAGAAIGAADGYRAVLRGEPVRTPLIKPGSSDPGGDGLLPGDRRLWVPLAGGGGLCLGGLYLASRRATRRRRAADCLLDEDPYPLVATATPRGLARMAQPLTPLTELDAEACRNLVDTDDAVRTSAEELHFATAQLGRPATRPFAEAVDWARSELADAFRLRQQLDDAPYEDEDARRHALDDICSRCTSANRRLDAESAAFDRLRGIRANAAALLVRAEAAARALAPRLRTAEAALAAVAAHCPEAALAPVARHPAEARDRLAFAGTALTEARAALADGDAEQAVVSLRAAEAALSQARTLAAAALRHVRELTGATARLHAVLRTMADAARDPREVIRALDPLEAARGETAAARDFVATHRGAVGCPARTLLAEAERRLALARGDPAQAAHATTLAREARTLAEHDVAGYDTPAHGVGGALLGGIILAGLLPPTFGGGSTRGRLGAP
ncbi:TPM domain-containing protein [Streptomyces sp. NPDC001404]|uniref:TPM domain-containing protein n=1 Tax=Streptomyces sp. NPDC001404 TaxID=3364571 RepID=UPI00367DC29C